MRKLVGAASIFALLVLLLMPFKSVWVGQFELTIAMNSDTPIDFSSVSVSTCRDEPEAEHKVENPCLYDYTFRSPYQLDSGDLVIGVQCSGSDSAFGFISTYHQPTFIVVEYRSGETPNTSTRKRFAIPDGRGRRSMTIDLP